MENIYQHHFNGYKNIYPYQNTYQSNVNMLEVQDNTGFLRIHIVDQLSGLSIPNATITIYVTDGIRRDIPVMHLITTLNPIRVELPISYDVGTQLIGPEYEFSTYNLRVDVFRYFANVVSNIRLFPNTTVDFEIQMVPITQIEMSPQIEERIDLPPHPRDILPSWRIGEQKLP